MTGRAGERGGGVLPMAFESRVLAHFDFLLHRGFPLFGKEQPRRHRLCVSELDFIRGARLVRHLAPFPPSSRSIVRARRSRIARDPPRARSLVPLRVTVTPLHLVLHA